MPSRNILKVDVPESYYHVYARGASKQQIFLEEQDYIYFLSLFERYLSKQQAVSKTGMAYPNYYREIDLVCYCLVTNHFHILLYQQEEGGMTKLMRGIMTSYSRYFNIKYKRSGALFESRYKASRIDQQNYLEHISRYIHLNTRYWKNYPYSSIGYYIKAKALTPEWLHPERILGLFKDNTEYTVFMQDHESHKQMLDEIKYGVADK